MKTDGAIPSGPPALNPQLWSEPGCFSPGPTSTEACGASPLPAAAAGTGRDEQCGVNMLLTGFSPYCLQVAGVSRTSPYAQFGYFQAT